MTLDAKRAYDTWLKVIADEDLYEAVIAGKHEAFAKARGWDAVDIAVLDELHKLPGTKWNIENLRFRCAGEAGALIQIYLPRTIKMLTRGITEWFQEVMYEYLAHYKWHVYGQIRIAECERFAEYTKKRILVRRTPPQHLEAVLDFELAVARLIRKTGEVDEKAWPRAEVPGDDVLFDLVPRWAPVLSVIEIPVDITEWIRSGDPLSGEVGPDPIDMLAVIPSLRDPYRLQKLNEATRFVLEQCKGEKTVGAIVEHVESELEIEPEQSLALIRKWAKERVLAF